MVGFHGQTILHDPDHGISIQLGNAGELAQRLGCQVVHSFRQDDLKAGGQGAPLAPIYHQAIMAELDLPLPSAMVNIGGISNISLVQGGKLIGFDSGPGNALMDDAMRKSRQRMGLEMIEIKACKTWMDNHVKERGEPVAVGFGFDQSPLDSNKAWWTTFLGLETPVYFGAEKWAHTYDAAVVYGAVRRTGRGRYKVEFRLVEENVKTLNKGHILDKCLGELEEEILNAPSDWLWSHKRWKKEIPNDINAIKDEHKTHFNTRFRSH